jgi:hypothetical protein
MPKDKFKYFSQLNQLHNNSAATVQLYTCTFTVNYEKLVIGYFNFKCSSNQTNKYSQLDSFPTLNLHFPCLHI